MSMSNSNNNKNLWGLSPVPVGPPRGVDARMPLGYVNKNQRKSLASAESSDADKKAERARAAQAKLRLATAAAWAPGKNLFMTGFMLWMSGSGVHIFSMMMTGMALLNPLRAMFGVSKSFARFEDPRISLLMPKLIFIAMNCVGIALALYKVNVMGLLPNQPSDWVSSLPLPVPLERSVGQLG